MSAPFRRVLLALEAPGQDEEFLRESVALAARLGVGLAGLLVEDEEVLRMGALPAARHFDALKGSLEPFAPGAMEREMRAQMTRAREQLARVCAQAGIPLSLQSVRARAGAAIEEASEENDLLVVTGSARLRSRGPELRTQISVAALHARRTVLVLQRTGLSVSEWLVPYDGSAETRRALALALQLAGRDGREITALLLGKDAAKLREEVLAALPESGVHASFIPVHPASARALESVLRQCIRGNLVLGAGWPLLEGGAAERLIAAAPGAVLVARGP